MFEALLSSLYEKAGDHHQKFTVAEHKELVDDFLPFLSIECEPLIGAAKAVFGETIFKDSEIGLEYGSTRPDKDGLVYAGIALGTLYIRRKREDRSISLNVDLLCCNPDRHTPKPASIFLQIEFDDPNGVDGPSGKEALQTLVKNYRRPLERLLEKNSIEFETSYCSGIVGKYKGKSALLKLDEYFSDPEACESVSFTRNFIGSVDARSIMQTFLLFSAIHHSCLGHMGKGRNIDRFAQHSARLL